MIKKHVALCPFLGAEGMVRPGQVLELDTTRARELLLKGLVVPEDEYEGEPLAEAQAASPEGETLTITPEALEAQRLATVAAQRASEDASLEPYKKAGGWYHFGESDALVKVQGRDAALAELSRREAASDAGDSPAGQ